MAKTKKLLVGCFYLIFLGSIMGISCAPEKHRAQTSMEIFMDYYRSMTDSLSGNPRYVCQHTVSRMSAVEDSTVYYSQKELICKKSQ